VKIVDDSGNELGPDVPGEILIRGRSLMDGYHNLPDVSQNAIVDGWLRTGDVGKKDADGFFYLLDRKKDMIIRGGFNVYPAEIERVLHDHPGVLEAAVIGVPHQILGEEACAIVVLRADAAASPAELEAFVAERLADFKRPRHWEFVEALPRSAMGKVLKRELRERFVQQPVEVAR
jgi:long-chain acyl-CoA synthetase